MTPAFKRLRLFLIILAVTLVLANYVIIPSLRNNLQLTIASPFGNDISIFGQLLRSKPITSKSRVVYGFLPYWTLEQAKYFQLDTLSDIAYFGLYIKKDGTFLKVDPNGETNPGYNNWRNNPKLDELIKSSKQYGVRVSLTVISHDDDISTAFLKCESCWTTLSQELIKELDAKNIKDVHLNFEYVGYVEDVSLKLAFTKFVRFLNLELDKKYGDSFLVVSSFADANIHDRITDIQSVSKSADGIFIMGYDFHRPTSDTAGPVAPIDGMGTVSSYDLRNTIKDYVAAAPPSKLILGVPYYGYNWVVQNSEPYAKRIRNIAETNDETDQDYTYENSPEIKTNEHSVSQAYDVIMSTVDEVKAEVLWDAMGKVPYFSYVSPESKVQREVYFENAESLKIKFDLAKENKFMGVGIWALGYDGDRQELWNLLRFVQK